MSHDCVVVGAGPAGLATSRALADRDVEHVVLERGRVGESWRTQRWESLQLNTPGWANAFLLGDLPPDSYPTAPEVVRRLDGLAVGSPVQTGVQVTGLVVGDEDFQLRTGAGDIRTRAVVVASGDENVPLRPTLAQAFPDRVAQFHSADYRRPGQLPSGAVLVVGSAQSGCQITEELLGAGREVYLATSPVGRVPGRYRGRTVAEWLYDAGFFDQRPEDLPDPALIRARVPILAPGARSLSLHLLARAGAKLVGRLVSVDRELLRFDASVAANVAAGDAFAARARGLIDGIIASSGVDAPPAEADDADCPVELDPPTELDLTAAGIGSVVWCTGFGSNFSWLDTALLDDRGRPRRIGTAAEIPGVWYVGLRWLTRRGSAQLPGMPRDAAVVADAVQKYLSLGMAPRVPATAKGDQP